MRYLLFVLLSLSLFSSSCDENNQDCLELEFTATYEGQPLVMYDQYNASKDRAVIYKVLEFFISNITITKTDGSTIDIKDIEYVKFTGLTSQSKAESGIKLLFTDIKAGDFQNISFGIGVTASLNATEPSDHSTSSYLGNDVNYWAPWNSYIFSQLEGSYFDANDNKTAFLYHAGVDGSYQQLSFNKTFSIKKNKTTTLAFELHAEDLLFKDGAEIDVPNNPQSHSGAVGTDAYNLALSSIQNIAKAIYIK